MEKFPQCDELKATYDACFQGWKEKCWREKRLNTLDECNAVFTVSNF